MQRIICDKLLSQMLAKQNDTLFYHMPTLCANGELSIF